MDAPDSFTEAFFCYGFCEGAEYGLYFDGGARPE